jgi:hypothetical protein
MSGVRWNRYLGWSLLVAGFAWAIWLDPWSLSERDPAALPGSARMAVRQAQMVVLSMAFLQIIVDHVLAIGIFPTMVRRVTACLTGAGAAAYCLGYVFGPSWPGTVWLIPLGALMNSLGFAILFVFCWSASNEESPSQIAVLKVILPVISFGMLLDAVVGLSAAVPSLPFHPLLGPEDGVRLRMLRLARVAAVALSVLTILYHGLIAQTEAQEQYARRGQMALMWGTVAMPIILTAAAFTTVHLKYLLPLPALALFVGTITGARLAKQQATPLELWSWRLIAFSMAVGLLMGLYAFDGPLPSPEFLGGYNDFARRLSRLGHAYAIVLGLLGIFVAREMNTRELSVPKREYSASRAASMGVPLLVVGSIITIVVILLVAGMVLPTRLLGLGPALVAVATILCMKPTIVLNGNIRGLEGRQNGK